MWYNAVMKEPGAIVSAVLHDIHLFADLAAADLQGLAALFGQRRFRKGETVFDEDSPGNSMMVIVAGEVRVSQKSGMHLEEALSILTKGDCFGEMALLENQPRSATVIAHTDLVILEISRDSFLAFVSSHPEAGVKILLALARRLSARLREADNKIRSFVSLSQWV